MNKGNRSIVFGGAAGIVTVGAIALASASGSTGGALMPAAGGEIPGATSTATSTATGTSTASATSPAPTSTASAPSSSTSSSSTPPSSTHTVPPKPTATETPSDDESPGGKFYPSPNAPGVTVTGEDGFTLTAFPGYCTAAQSFEHLRSSTVLVHVPDLPKAVSFVIKVEGAGPGTRAYENKPAGKMGGKIGPVPLQWTGTKLFSIGVYAEGYDGSEWLVGAMSWKDGRGGEGFAQDVSRWCDAKGKPNAPKPPKGHGSDVPSGLPTGPRVQTG